MTKFAQKEYFQPEIEKENTTTGFYIFELGYNFGINILRLFDVLPNFLFNTS